jgi:hypothetical protein
MTAAGRQFNADQELVGASMTVAMKKVVREPMTKFQIVQFQRQIVRK